MTPLILDLLLIKEKCHKLFGLFAPLISQLKDVIALGQRNTLCQPHYYSVAGSF